MLSLLSVATELAVEKIEIFMLVLVRISFIIFLIPAFNLKEIPTSVKAILSLVLGLLVYPQLPHVGFVIADSTVFFFLLVLEQALVGILIGFTSSFLWFFVVMGGSHMARDIGITQGGMDPITEEHSDYVSSLLLIIFFVIFLASGAHYFFIRILFESFQYIPIGHLAWDMRSFAGALTLLSASAFVMSFKLAAPVMGTLLVVTVVLGLMNRVMQQFQAWILGVPIKVVLGVVVIIYAFPLMEKLFDANFEMLQRALLFLLKQGGAHGG